MKKIKKVKATHREDASYPVQELSCKRCKYDWDYSGKAIFWATCPKCLGKVRIYIKEKKNE